MFEVRYMNREELRKIRRTAVRISKENINPLWSRAYERLADAAFALEAIVWMTDETKEEKKQNRKIKRREQRFTKATRIATQDR